MAFFEPMGTDSIAFGSDNAVFNVSRPVGSNADNFWSDIMLVQYLIHIIYDINKITGKDWSMTAATRADLDDLPDPNKDFKALTKTAKWIKHFQTDGVLMNSMPIIATGRVERGHYKKDDEFDKTIYALNFIFKRSAISIGHKDWTGFALDDKFLPHLLRAQLVSNVQQE